MATNSHKRDTNARRIKVKAAYVAAPVALLATLAPVAAGVVAASPEAREAATRNTSAVTPLTRDTAVVSRDASRAELAAQKAEKAAQETAAAVAAATQRLWTTEELNLWSAPGEQAQMLGTIPAGRHPFVTGRRVGERAEIVIPGAQARWVTAAYLSAKKPVLGVSSAPCANGSSVPGGVDPNLVKVHRAVCAKFPELTSYGTFRGDGEHSQGRAIDIMVSGARGFAVRDFLRANYAKLGISYIIYSQRIWTVERAGEGWRWMSSRGSATANHYDHVHVTVF